MELLLELPIALGEVLPGLAEASLHEAQHRLTSLVEKQYGKPRSWWHDDDPWRHLMAANGCRLMWTQRSEMEATLVVLFSRGCEHRGRLLLEEHWLETASISDVIDHVANEIAGSKRCFCVQEYK